jgi:hypothetical protein
MRSLISSFQRLDTAAVGRFKYTLSQSRSSRLKKPFHAPKSHGGDGPSLTDLYSFFSRLSNAGILQHDPTCSDECVNSTSILQSRRPSLFRAGFRPKTPCQVKGPGSETTNTALSAIYQADFDALRSIDRERDSEEVGFYLVRATNRPNSPWKPIWHQRVPDPRKSKLSNRVPFLR